MNPQVKVEIEKAPIIAELITRQLNQFGYLGNMANLLALKNAPALIDVDRFMEENSTFMLLLKIVEENFTYSIKTNFCVGMDEEKINSFSAPSPSYKNLHDLLEGIAPPGKKEITLTDFCLGYIVYWQSYGNIRAIKLLAETDARFQHVLNLSIYDLYNKYCRSNTIDAFFNDLFEEYYNGYILGDDVLNNLFVGRVRLYIFLAENKEKQKIAVRKFLDIIFDTELLFREENKKTVIQAYKALVKFCYDKLDECLASNDETELILSHAKLTGLVGLIRKIAHEYDLLDNIQLTFSKDFFEEIHCDCAPWATYSYSFFKAPAYVHWVLRIMSLESGSESVNMEKILSASKERIFLSQRVSAYMNSQDLTSLDRDKFFEEIKLNYSALDERIIMPLYFLKNIQPQTLRKTFFDAEQFEEVYKAHGTYSADVYEKYTKLTIHNVNELNGDVKEAIFKAHSELWKIEVRELMQVNFQEDIPINEKLDVNRLVEQIYPYSSIVKQEVAILLDMNGDHSRAADTVCKGLLLDFNNPLLWQSFLVILRNLNLLESWQIVKQICSVLNEDQ